MTKEAKGKRLSPEEISDLYNILAHLCAARLRNYKSHKSDLAEMPDPEKEALIERAENLLIEAPKDLELSQVMADEARELIADFKKAAN